MAIFARINDFGEVITVTSVNNKILKDSGGEESELRGIAFLRTLYKEQTSVWVQGSYNTQAGVHKLGGTPFRKNYAGIGFTYDESKDAFIPAKKYASWTLNESTCLWEPPIPRPDDEYEVIDGLNTITKRCEWNESTLSWDKVEV